MDAPRIKNPFCVSVLADISTPVFAAKTPEEAKQLIIETVSMTNIKSKDTLLKNLDKIQTLPGIHKYFCNALLRFEGLSTNPYIQV